MASPIKAFANFQLPLLLFPSIYVCASEFASAMTSSTRDFNILMQRRARERASLEITPHYFFFTHGVLELEVGKGQIGTYVSQRGKQLIKFLTNVLFCFHKLF